MTVPEGSTVSATVHDLIIERFAPGFEAGIGENEVLTEIGAIDSLRMVDLVLTLEQEFGLRVPASDLIEENFSTIRAITAYISRRLG